MFNNFTTPLYFVEKTGKIALKSNFTDKYVGLGADRQCIRFFSQLFFYTLQIFGTVNVR